VKKSALLLSAFLIVLAACRGEKPAPAPAPNTAAASGPTLSPVKAVSTVIQPERGGTVTLRDGAEVMLPPGSVSDATVATLRVDDAASAAPIPRSNIGRAYRLELDGGDLTGIARVKLPLPPKVSGDQFELAAYRWNGRAWERLSGRLGDQDISFGTNTPGTYVIQGKWKPASAAVALARTDTEAVPETIPVVAAGQYRYSELPTLQHDYVPARLTLKRDSSGGAGQVTGDDSLDQTLADTVLWFKPDPAQAEGVIEFSHVFELVPGKLNVSPGDIARFYAVLTVDDSAAPTRVLSTAIEYTQMLPIRAVGSEVLRPELANEGKQPLRWHVKLNDQTLASIPATGLTLPLAELLAKGGLGDYHITLEAEFGGKWVLASNEVTVQLKLPATQTPLPGETLQPSGGEIAAVGLGTPGPTPIGPPPPTPTRRSPPGQATPEATEDLSLTAAVAGLTATITPTRPAWAQVFWADRYAIAPSECTTLHWNLQNVQEVHLDSNPVTGSESRQVCPSQTTTYNLHVTDSAGTQDWYVTITVQTSDVPAFVFTADDYQIAHGKCTTLRWQATEVRAVYLNGEGVDGVSSRQVCPETSTTYTLRVESSNGTATSTDLNVSVAPADEIVISFWADQYTLSLNGCTDLHWSVQDVKEVHLEIDGQQEGVTGVGTRHVCPDGWQDYILSANTSDGRSASKEFSVEATDPSLGPDEVIGQAIVKEVVRVTDLNPDVDGDQPGWNLMLDGLNPLFRGSGSSFQTNVTLEVPEVYVDQASGEPVDWPISASQLIEFRAGCVGATCTLESTLEHYLRLRSG
jgi:hypothetical protein